MEIRFKNQTIIGCDIIWQKPNITELVVCRWYHSFRQNADLITVSQQFRGILALVYVYLCPQSAYPIEIM